MRETMAQLLAMSQGGLMQRLEFALKACRDDVAAKQAIIAALSVLLGEPRREGLADMLERAAERARKDG